MAITQWNDEEDDALQGLPMDAQLLYLRGLRRMMDFGTGEVGRKHRISWQGLGEVLYVEPQQGCVNTGSLSRDRLKRAAKWLERAGLVVMRSSKAEKHLIFFMPLADREKSAKNKPARNPPDQPAPRKTKTGNETSEKPDHAQPAQPALYPMSDKTTLLDTISIPPYAEKASSGKAAPESASPEVRLAVLLRSLGVDVLPMNPLLSQWITELAVTSEECDAVVALCRRHLGSDTKIPYKYFDKTLRSSRTPAGERKSNTERRQQTYAGLTGKQSRTSHSIIDGTAVTVECS